MSNGPLPKILMNCRWQARLIGTLSVFLSIGASTFLLLVTRTTPKTLEENYAVPWSFIDKSTELYTLEDYAASTHESFGISMTGPQLHRMNRIKNALGSSLCPNNPSCWMNLMKCKSCPISSGEWYVANSGNKVNVGHIHSVNDTITLVDDGNRRRFQNFDIAIPSSGADHELKKFFSKVGPTIKACQSGPKSLCSGLNFRFFITRFQGENATNALLNDLANRSRVNKESIHFIPVNHPKPGNGHKFSRSKALNALHLNVGHDDDCLMAVMDIHMVVKIPFIINALTFVHVHKSAYFPIFWSEYNPEHVNRTRRFLVRQGKKSPKGHSQHRGVWRQFSFGMYAMPGSDAPRVLYDEQFDGWGGEDNSFFAQMREALNIVRMRDTGLIHTWHPKHCSDDFVGESFKLACESSLAATEGTQLSLYLKTQELSKER